VLASHAWRKSAQYPMNRRLGGPKSRSGRCGGIEKFVAPDGNLNPAVHPVVSICRPVLFLFTPIFAAQVNFACLGELESYILISLSSGTQKY
jgi:hypothetical protein